MGHCPTKYLTGWHIQLVVRNSRWVSLRRRLVGEMAHGSLQLAIAPRAFAGGELVFSACLAGACGFVMGDSVRVSGAATPGKCPHCSVRDWPSARTGSAPTLHQRGPCGCAASPARVFASPALDTRSGVLLLDRRCSSLQEAFTLYNLPPKRCGWEQKGGMR